jgi:plasmid stabilization system protein ParE
MKLRFTPRGDARPHRHRQLHPRARSAILDSLRNLVLFPEIGRRQTVEGVRKLVTRKYPYLVYYTLDLTAEEIIILTIQHPAREREYEDA